MVYNAFIKNLYVINHISWGVDVTIGTAMLIMLGKPELYLKKVHDLDCILGTYNFQELLYKGHKKQDQCK